MTNALLALLVPDATDPKGLEACVQLARSLNGDEKPGPVDLDIVRAEIEYESAVRSAALGLCSDLFHLHLASLTCGATVLRGGGLEAWRTPPGSAKDVWIALLELEGRGLGLALPSLPGPGESAGQVAARILNAAECLGVGEVELALWRAHLITADQGPSAGARSYREVMGLGEMDFADLEAAHLGYLGCLMARGAVSTALDWSEAHMDLAAASPRLLRLAGWIQLAVGDREAAEEYLVPQPRVSLPAPIAALGDRIPDLQKVIGGSAEWRSTERIAPIPWTGSRRKDVGAAALCLVHLERGQVSIGHTELAPGLERPRQAWLDRQEVAPFEQGEPEYEVLETQTVVVYFPSPEGDLAARRVARGCLSSRCLGLALIPLFSEQNGALAGWLRLEFEHRLVPENERLERFAKVVGRRLGLGAKKPLPQRLACPQAPDLFAEALAGFSLGRRRWWGAALCAGGVELLCSDGTALEDWQQSPGGRALLDQCLGARRPLAQGQEEADFIHRESRSGIAIPLGPDGGAQRFALVVESIRAGDLGIKDVAGLLRGHRGDLRGLGTRLEAAAFNQHHRDVYGEDLRFLSLSPAPRPEHLHLGRLEALASNPKPTGGPLSTVAKLGPGALFISGTRGTGKRTVARLRAFLNGQKLNECQAKGLTESGLEAALREPASLIRDLGELTPEVQVCLFEAIESGRAESLVVTARQALDQLGLWPRLSETLGIRQLALAGLDRRRAEIPDLFGVGLDRAARTQATIPPVLTDAAEALLWRQSWSRGIYSLLDLARRIVPLTHGREVDASELFELATGLGWQFETKLSTRQPDESALWQALVMTRKKTGSFHRGRAAALLGWDPDTLAARLKQMD